MAKAALMDQKDLELMGSTPRLDLEHVHEDPVLTRNRTEAINRLSDERTALNRKISRLDYAGGFTREVTNGRKHAFNKRQVFLHKHAAIVDAALAELKTLSEQQDAEKERVVKLKEECESLQAQLDSTIFEIDRLMPKDSLFSADHPTSHSDFDREEEQPGDIISQIHEPEVLISHRTQARRRAQLEASKLAVQLTDLDRELAELELSQGDLEARIAKASEKWEANQRKKAVPIDSVHFQEGIIEELERATDECERRLTRSRVDAIEYDLQTEFSQYQTLRRDNQQRSENIEKSKRELAARKDKQLKLERQIQSMRQRLAETRITPVKDQTDSPIVGQSPMATKSQLKSAPTPCNERTPSKSPRAGARSEDCSTPARIRQLREERIKQLQEQEFGLSEEVAKLESLHDQHEAERSNVQANLQEKFDLFRDLTEKVEEINRARIQRSNAIDRLGALRVQETELAAKVAKLSGAKSSKHDRVRGMKSREQLDEMSRSLDERRTCQVARADALKERKLSLEKRRKEVDGLATAIENTRESAQTIDHQVDEMSAKLDSTVSEIGRVTRKINMARRAALARRMPGMG
jgi:chromosome segregation ATPase